MTISEALYAKIQKVKIIGLVCWLAFVAAIVFQPPESHFLFFFIPFVGFIGCIFYVVFFITCPKCHIRLGQALISSGNVFSKRSKINFCPGCGIDLNTEQTP
ncbi:MAG: hypothetical protein U1F12_04205 [Pseudomonadales bacterium]|jgi:hypothetical protein|nr:hypothetical protein [Pseudomonadales bacterium]